MCDSWEMLFKRYARMWNLSYSPIYPNKRVGVHIMIYCFIANIIPACSSRCLYKYISFKQHENTDTVLSKRFEWYNYKIITVLR